MREFVLFLVLAVALVLIAAMHLAIVWLDRRLNDRVTDREVLEYE